jgi:hypothetical protein
VYTSEDSIERPHSRTTARKVSSSRVIFRDTSTISTRASIPMKSRWAELSRIRASWFRPASWCKRASSREASPWPSTQPVSTARSIADRSRCSASTGTAGVPEHHPDHLVGAGLVHAHAELFEDVERRLGAAQRVAVLLPGMADLGVVELAESLEVHVAEAGRDGRAPGVVALGHLVLTPMHRDQTEVVVGDRAAALVHRLAECFQRALIVVNGRLVVTMDGGHDAQVLLDAPPELLAHGGQLEGPLIRGARCRHVSGLEVEAAERVQRLAGEDEVPHGDRAVIALPAELSGFHAVVPLVVHHAEAALGFSQYRPLAALLPGGHGLLIRRDRVVQAAGAVVGPSNPEQIARWAKLRMRGLWRNCGEPVLHRQ